MPGEVIFTMVDFSQEKSTFGLQTRTATSANFDTINGELDTLQAAVLGVVAGTMRTRRLVAQINTVDPADPSDAIAQRELKWLVTLTDDVDGSKIQREIPTADVGTNGLLIAGTDIADLSHAAWVALAAAIDGIFQNPKTGNTVSLSGARLVGRNL